MTGDNFKVTDEGKSLQKNSEKEGATSSKSEVFSERKISVSPTFTLDSSFEPFNEYYTIFARIMWDKSLKTYGQSMYANIPKIIKENKPGYTRFEHALAVASWTVHDYFQKGFSWKKLGNPNNVMAMQELSKLEITDENITKMTKILKTAAKSFGASLVGIAPFDKRWLYSHNRKNEPINLPAGITSVIALGIEMDPLNMGTSPALTHGLANGLGYSKMAFLVSIVAEFIRLLGYQAIPCGNDTALSIPIAIDAGFGQLGRNGLLITKDFGPRVRLCKVFTDMPLEHDEPVDFGVTDVCRQCKKCAEACEVDAISFEEEPSFEVPTISNNKGILRWAVNHEKCYEFWVENGGECSTCITVCPYNLRTGGEKNVDPQKYWEQRFEEL
ncbi:MAG: reductive dehalogenase [Candidatus Heimdallarchaeota archaeon]|nr:reductive dehalogenase [Candidatus Heimdallarchaeota archaeon]